MNTKEWKSQIKRGTLEYCILLMINQKECYGYELINELEQWPILSAKESTLYPLLRRLVKEGYCSSFWKESIEGLPPRKYYRITDQGKEVLMQMDIEWENLQNAIDEIKGVKLHGKEL